jgi:hypothetical protein
MAINGNSGGLPPEAITFATRIYDAARSGQIDIFQQALPAGLPANMTNEKGDSLVCIGSHNLFCSLHSSYFFWLKLTIPGYARSLPRPCTSC